ncbi:MAG TPA: hypothetical protein VN259_13665 [Xanthomonadales bacterium]|nr:hypothetical protein [Xanthomonadales bacterium]
MSEDAPDESPAVVETGPFVADASGVYTRERGAEQWWVMGLCLAGVALIALLPLSLEQRMQVSLSLVAGGGIGSLLATWWRSRRPLPLVLLQGETLLCFAPGIVPKLVARFPTDAVTSVALSPSPAGIQLEWLFRGGEQGRFTLSPDARLAIPLAHFLGSRFGTRFKDHRA